MFEKEAEDSFKCKKVLYKWETDKHSYIDGFKDGAEFGYNKCNEQLIKAKELIEELISSLSVVGECGEEECELLNRAEQFLKDSIE